MKNFLITLIRLIPVLLIPLFAKADKIIAVIKPVNEVQQDSSFVSFSKNLKAAIKNKDSAFIAKILSADVMYSLGYHPEHKNAVDGFLKYYEVNNSKGSAFWKDLNDVIELGCTKSGDFFECPYVNSKWPDKFDSYEHVVTVVEKTPIYSKPDAKAKVVRIANFEVLKLTDKREKEGWYNIDLGSKKMGYIAKSNARSPIDYRVQFQKTSTGWKMKYFITGD